MTWRRQPLEIRRSGGGTDGMGTGNGRRTSDQAQQKSSSNVIWTENRRLDSKNGSCEWKRQAESSGRIK